MTKTIDQKILEMKEKISQYENQMKQLIQKQREAERKARTHRLIERGALLESLLDGFESLTNEDIKAVLTAALSSDAAHETLVFIRKKQRVASSTDTASMPASAPTPAPMRVVKPAADETPMRELRSAKAPEGIREDGA